MNEERLLGSLKLAMLASLSSVAVFGCDVEPEPGDGFDRVVIVQGDIDALGAEEDLELSLDAETCYALDQTDGVIDTSRIWLVAPDGGDAPFDRALAEFAKDVEAEDLLSADFTFCSPPVPSEAESATFEPRAASLPSTGGGVWNKKKEPCYDGFVRVCVTDRTGFTWCYYVRCDSGCKCP